jgi:BolA protein|tara:strand:+ start:319 stop:570 length:252 start_codon:yes stop_codon:yes gene_type:complete
MDFLSIVKEKIVKKINPENIVLIDNSHLHAKHRFYEKSKFHIKVILKSEKLKKMNKVDAHKVIFSILKKEMSNKIHALEIEIN